MPLHYRGVIFIIYLIIFGRYCTRQFSFNSGHIAKLYRDVTHVPDDDDTDMVDAVEEEDSDTDTSDDEVEDLDSF